MGGKRRSTPSSNGPLEFILRQAVQAPRGRPLPRLTPLPPPTPPLAVVDIVLRVTGGLGSTDEQREIARERRPAAVRDSLAEFEQAYGQMLAAKSRRKRNRLEQATSVAARKTETEVGSAIGHGFTDEAIVSWIDEANTEGRRAVADACSRIRPRYEAIWEAVQAWEEVAASTGIHPMDADTAMTSGTIPTEIAVASEALQEHAAAALNLFEAVVCAAEEGFTPDDATRWVTWWPQWKGVMVAEVCTRFKARVADQMHR